MLLMPKCLSLAFTRFLHREAACLHLSYPVQSIGEALGSKGELHLPPICRHCPAAVSCGDLRYWHLPALGSDTFALCPLQCDCTPLCYSGYVSIRCLTGCFGDVVHCWSALEAI